MKKLLVVLVAMLMTVAINAQAKKSIDDFAKKAGVSKEQVMQIKALTKEKSAAVKAIKAKKLDKATTKAKIKALNKATRPKIEKILGKEKMKEFNAYWKKPKKGKKK